MILKKEPQIDLRIGGLVPFSTADMPGYLSTVLFCQGCPWKCRYCHNPHLIPVSEGLYSWSFIEDFLGKRMGLLEAVVFSGGEPTLQKSLPLAIRQVKEMGFKIGLHTAGQYPDILSDIIKDIDWVGMDIKAPMEKYCQITGRPNISDRIVKSVDIILSSKKEYEFRTTAHVDLISKDDLISIANFLRFKSARKYCIQLFRKTGCIDESLNFNSKLKYNLEDIKKNFNSIFNEFEVRVS